MKLERQRDKLIQLLNDAAISREYKKAVRWALCRIDELILNSQQQAAALITAGYEIRQLDEANMARAKLLKQVREDNDKQEQESQKFLESLRDELTARFPREVW